MPRRLPVLTMAALALPVLAATTLAQGAPTATGAAAATTSPVLTSSSAARQEFVAGVEDVAYLFNGRAAQRFDRALALDSTYGLARVFKAAFAPQLDQAQRDSAAARGVADAAHGSADEVKLAAAVRELAANRPEAAQPLFRELADMHPDNALYAMWGATDWAGTRSPAANVEALRAVTTRFPSYAAPYNTLAYTLLAAGDTAGALAAAEKQVQLAPAQPNAHDSYAELLQFTGRLDDAATHYTQATTREPSFTEGYVGLAEVRQLQHRGADARAALGEAIRHALNLPDSLRYMEYVAQSDVADGRDSEAAQELTEVARLAESRGARPQAAAAHRDMALLAALGGDTPGVARQLAEARDAGAADTPARQRMHAEIGALAYMIAGDADSLRALAGRDSSHLARAMVALHDGHGDEALTELALADTTAPIAQELGAEAQARADHADAARAGRERLLARRDAIYFNAPDLRNVVALRRAAKM